MPDSIVLRKATLDDFDALLRWRNDPDTLANSHQNQPVGEADHLHWLTSSLQDPNRQIFIAVRQSDGLAVGTVRADNRGDHCLLSWTVNPDCRGQGIAKGMVRKFTDNFQSEIRAEIRNTNLASIRVAEFCGMTPWQQMDDFLYFRRLPPAPHWGQTQAQPNLPLST